MYLLDGYNLIFSLFQEEGSISKKREQLVSDLQKMFRKLQLKGVLVFDGAHRREEESGRGYQSPLEIVYTPKGQTADSAILEILTLSSNPKEITLVTRDKGLIRQARAKGCHVQSPQQFVQFLEKRKQKPQEEKQVKETKQNIERLLKIFTRKDEGLD